jgi:hypothetical protein
MLTDGLSVVEESLTHSNNNQSELFHVSLDESNNNHEELLHETASTSSAMSCVTNNRTIDLSFLNKRSERYFEGECNGEGTSVLVSRSQQRSDFLECNHFHDFEVSYHMDVARLVS